MNQQQLALVADLEKRVADFHNNPAMVAAFKAFEALTAARAAYMASRESAAANVAALRDQLLTVQEAEVSRLAGTRPMPWEPDVPEDQQEEARTQSMGSALDDLENVYDTLRDEFADDDVAEDVLLHLTNAAEALAEVK